MSDQFQGRNPFVIPRPILYRGGVNVETIADDVTMTPRSSTFQRLNGGVADRTLTLPSIATYDTNGLVYEVYNAGSTNDLILSDGSTVKTLTPGSWARLASDGTDWYVIDSTSAGTTDLGDSTALNFGDANDITMQWDGTRFLVGQATPNSEIRWGVDGAGLDQIWYGDTASVSMTWDQTADSLIFTDAAKLVFGTGSDISANFDGTNLVFATAVADTGAIVLGADDAGVDLILYGDTAGVNVTWDQSADSLIFTDSAILALGSGSDITAQWNGSKLLVGQATPNSAIDFGIDGAGIDLVLYGDTASAKITWDQSDDSLVLAGVAKIKTQTIADPGTGNAIPVTASGSIAITTAAAETNTLADPTFMGQWLSIFVDTYAVGDRVITAASRINQTGNTIITLGAAGDYIKLEAITIGGALKWQVVANDGAALS